MVGRRPEEFGHKAGGAKRTKEETPTPRTKSEIAKASAKRVDSDIQRYAEEYNEPIFAKRVGGKSFRDNEPVDVVVIDKGVIRHGIELKTMVSNANAKITMKGSAMARKAQWMKENRAPFHTVVIDDTYVKDAKGPGLHDETKRRILYRRGFGSFRTGGMYEVKSYAELKKLMNTSDADLPAAAKPSASYPKIKPRRAA